MRILKSRFIKSRSGRTLIALAVMLVLLSGAFAVNRLTQPAAPAHASGATYGQQVELICSGYRIWDTYIYGTNQNNQYAAWHGSGNGQQYVYAQGWWWIGWTKVDFWMNNQWYHRWYYVTYSNANSSVYDAYC